MCIYISCVQDSWFELTLSRSTETKLIPGQLPGLTKHLADLFFGDLNNLSTICCNLALHDGIHMLITADLGVTVADEAALHFMFSCKGSSGLKVGFSCINVYNQKNPRRVVEKDATGMSIYYTWADVSKFQPFADDILDAILARLQRASTTLSKTEFHELEARLGWAYNPHGLVACPIARRRCNPSRCLCYGWAHVVFVNGVFNIHAGLLLKTLQCYNHQMEAIHEYVSQFLCPKCLSDRISPADVFSAPRLASLLAATTLKCTVSEGISLAPVLAVYCEGVMRVHDSAVVRGHMHFLSPCHWSSVVTCAVPVN